MARIAQVASAMLLAAAVAIYLYFNVVHKAYYYPGAYEDALVATLFALLMAVPGVVGLIAATFVIWRRNRAKINTAERR
jgi:hypothetical protein